ncbi:MAG: transketolase [Candidatus Micrarchaeota archaeon]
MKSVEELELKANDIRQDIVRMLANAGSGHTAGPLGMADVFATLYFGIAMHDPKKPDWDGRDRIVLSNGHICPVLYSTLAECGYFDKKKLLTLRKLGSPLQGHPHRGEVPGVENSSGPLGQGLSQACGMALAGKIDKKKHIVYCLTSDGEHNEGATWEAAMFAAKYKLGNLVQIMDRNYIQIDGNTEDVMPLEPLAEKYLAFGWNVIEVDGNDIGKLIDVLESVSEKARENSEGTPTIIIAKTIPGKGVSFVEGSYKWHGIAPKKEEAEKAIGELQEARKKIGK